MAKRELEEINAGSMADIAFLLLIFFLVTTTMNFPKALEERLPQKIETPPVLLKAKNVLEILANSKDQIQIEGQRGSIEEIKDKVLDFYVHPKGDPNWPDVTPITESEVKSKIKHYKAYSAQYPENTQLADTLRIWERKQTVLESIGPYNEISPQAMVTIQLDNATKFKTYIAVLNEIMAGINELRSKLCMEKFGVPYSKLNPKVEADKDKIKALREVYPKRIMKAKSRNSGAAS